jgi:hypothetical protein
VSKGDWVEIVVESGGGSRVYEITATKAGRRVETSTVRGVVEVTEVTRTGQVVRTAALWRRGSSHWSSTRPPIPAGAS